MSAETAPSTVPTISAAERVQREQMLMNGIGGDDSQDRAEAVMNYGKPIEVVATESAGTEVPVTQTVAEASAAELLNEFNQSPDTPPELSEAAAIAADAQSEREKAVDAAHSAAQKAARRALDTVAGSSGTWMNADLDQTELDRRQAIIDSHYATRR